MIGAVFARIEKRESVEGRISHPVPVFGAENEDLVLPAAKRCGYFHALPIFGAEPDSRGIEILRARALPCLPALIVFPAQGHEVVPFLPRRGGRAPFAGALSGSPSPFDGLASRDEVVVGGRIGSGDGIVFPHEFEGAARKRAPVLEYPGELFVPGKLLERDFGIAAEAGQYGLYGLESRESIGKIGLFKGGD